MLNPVWKGMQHYNSAGRGSEHDLRGEFCCIVPGRPIWSLGCWQAIPHRLPRRGAGLACSGTGPTPEAPEGLVLAGAATWLPPEAQGKVRRCALEHKAGIADSLHSSMPLQARPDLAGWVASSGCGALGCEARHFAPQGIFSRTDKVRLAFELRRANCLRTRDRRVDVVTSAEDNALEWAGRRPYRLSTLSFSQAELGIELGSTRPNVKRQFAELTTAPETGVNRLLDLLPAAIYTTDAVGRISYFNEAAAGLWGCRPELGSAEFCGAWKLFWPDGSPLPNAQ